MHVPAHGIFGSEDEGDEGGYLECESKGFVTEFDRESREEMEGVWCHGTVTMRWNRTIRSGEVWVLCLQSSLT